MKKFKKNELLKKCTVIPEKTGVFVLLRMNTIIFSKFTENLAKFIHIYVCSDVDDTNIKNLINEFDELVYFETDSLIESFIVFNIINHTGKYNDFSALTEGIYPEYNNKIKAWYSYIYLAVDFIKPPYLKTSNDTVEDNIYIGPFRNSFLLNDALDTFSDIFKLPRCESSDFPCFRLTENKCLGFCQNKLQEALPELINKMILIPNKEIINKLIEKKESLLDDLKFIESEHISNQILNIQRYYKNLLFCYVSQFIDGEFTITINIGKNLCKLIVREGMIEELIRYSDNTEEYIEDYLNIAQSDLSNRKDNELLAYDKSEYDHRWTIFRFLIDTEPDNLENILQNNIEEIQKYIFKEINGGSYVD